MKAASLALAALLAALPAAAQESGAMDGPSMEGPAAAPADPAAAPGQPAAKVEKTGPYFGFSFGTGKGTLYAGGSSMDVDDAFFGEPVTTFHMQLRSGFGQGDFLIGGQLNWTRSFADLNGVSAGFDFRAFDIVGTWWNQEMGLYSRVGIGPSFASSYVGDVTSDTFSGVELMFGVGATMGGLGVGIDFFRQSYDEAEAGIDSVSYMLVTLSLDMY